MRNMLALAVAGYVLALPLRADDPPAPTKDSFDGLLASIAKTMNEIGDALGQVVDEKSAKDATPKLQKLAQSMNDLLERSRTLGKPTADEAKALESKYLNDLTNASKKLATEKERLKDKAFGKSALDALNAKAKAAPEKPKVPADKPKDK